MKPEDVERRQKARRTEDERAKEDSRDYKSSGITTTTTKSGAFESQNSFYKHLSMTPEMSAPGDRFERVAGFLIKVKFDFPGGDKLDLPCTAGEMLTPHDRNKDWYVARNDAGKMGLVPRAYVEEVTT